MELDLNEITEFAKLQFTHKEVCVVLAYPPEVIHRPDFIQAYEKGRLLQEAAVRKSIFNLASGGSSPAQCLAMDLIEKARINNVGE